MSDSPTTPPLSARASECPIKLSASGQAPGENVTRSRGWEFGERVLLGVLVLSSEGRWLCCVAIVRLSAQHFQLRLAAFLGPRFVFPLDFFIHLARLLFPRAPQEGRAGSWPVRFASPDSCLIPFGKIKKNALDFKKYSFIIEANLTRFLTRLSY